MLNTTQKVTEINVYLLPIVEAEVLEGWKHTKKYRHCQ